MSASILSEEEDNKIGARFDAWTNTLTKLGVKGKDHTLATDFLRRPNCVSREETEALYEQEPIFARIIDAVPEHATRRWIKVTGTGPTNVGDFGKAVLDGLEELDAQGRFYDALRWDRLDGGAAIVIGANDGQTPDYPLDLEKIESLDYLNVVSRYEIFPQEWDRDPMSPTFRKPLYFTFGGNPMGISSQRVHYSRVIQFTGIQTTERRYLANSGWGLPVVERVYEAVRQFGTLYGYIESMFKDVVQGVFKIEGLATIISADDGSKQLFKRMQAMSMMASAFNAIVVSDGEEYERRVAQFSGVSDIIIRTMDRLAAVAEMPLSILFGQPPTGLSTDDESGRKMFYDGIANKQHRILREPLRRVIDIMLRAKNGPTQGQIPETWDYQFRPLDQPNEAQEEAARYNAAQTDQLYIMTQVITPAEARTRLSNDPRSPYILDPSVDVAEEMLKLPDPTAGSDVSNSVKP